MMSPGIAAGKAQATSQNVVAVEHSIPYHMETWSTLWSKAQ